MRRTTQPFIVVALAALALSCTKNEAPSSPPADQAESSESQTTAEGLGELPPQLAARLKTSEKRAEEISARFTPELRDAVSTLKSTAFETTDAALEAILASPHRAPGNAERDPYRHPRETLAAFGIRPDMKVFEYAQGGGWYTEILAPLLAREGAFFLAGYDKDSDEQQQRFGARMMELFIDSPGNLYDDVQLVQQSDLSGPPNLGKPGSLDMVLVIRMMHNVERANLWDSLLPAIHASLATGGVLGVVQHRAAEGADPQKSAPQGYLPEPWLVERIEGYGFKLEARFEINANPKDTKDYPQGVWTLPPILALEQENREKYVEIGESDRSTLKFVKVES